MMTPHIPNWYKKMFYFFVHQVLKWVERTYILKAKIYKRSDFYKNKKVTKVDDINKKVTKVDDIDANKILICKEEAYGTKNSFKYFIG